MKYYLITDTHFGHQKLIEKGYRPADFEKQIINGIDRTIDHTHTLIHLGDVCMGNDRINNKKLDYFFKKILVRGNHDHKSDSWYYDQGWDFVCDQFTLKKFSKTIVFSHEPLKEFEGDINIHGHWHDNDHRKEPDFERWYGKRHKLLAMELTNYQPVELHKFIS